MSEETQGPEDNANDEIQSVPQGKPSLLLAKSAKLLDDDLVKRHSQGSGQTEETAIPPTTVPPVKPSPPITDESGSSGGGQDGTSRIANTNTRPPRSCCFACGTRETTDEENQLPRSRRCRVCFGGSSRRRSRTPTSRRRSSVASPRCLRSPRETYQWLTYYIPVLEWLPKYKGT